MKILFLNKTQTLDGNIKIISNNIVELSNVEQNISGFKIYKNGFLLGDYSNFNTLYRVLKNSYQLSNNGSVYVETDDSKEETLEEIKEQKISEMNYIQQGLINQGVEVELSDGTKERFTLNTNDQLSLNSLSVKSLEGLSLLPWHPADESVHCKFYSEEDMKRITNTCMSYVTYHVTYFRDLRIYIRSLQTKEDVQNVNYGMDIPEKYQSEVLKSLYIELGL